MPEGLRILCCGDQNWTDVDGIRYVLGSWIMRVAPPLLSLDEITIVVGGGMGAESIVRHTAKKLGLRQLVFPFDWKQARKRYGANWKVERERHISTLLRQKPHAVMVFSDRDPNDMLNADPDHDGHEVIQLAVDRGIPTVLWFHAPDGTLTNALVNLLAP